MITQGDLIFGGAMGEAPYCKERKLKFERCRIPRMAQRLIKTSLHLAERL